MIEYVCPNCNTLLLIDEKDVTLDENFICSACGKPAFPDLAE